MDVLRPEEERPEELQGHVVELHVGSDHLRQFLNHLRLPPALGRSVEETGSGLVGEQHVLFVFNVLKMASNYFYSRN